MKFMITGSSGYIGLNLVKHLQGEDCTCIKYDATLGMDILDERMLYQKMKGCDAVVHLAALPDVSYCERNVSEAIEINLLGTRNVVDAAKMCVVPLHLDEEQLETQGKPPPREYGIPVIMISTFAAKAAHNVYGLTKRLAEKIVLRSDDNVVLRLANVYGGIGYLQKKRSAVSSFIKHKKNSVVATIYGDGSNERDFVHVSDVCNAIMLAIGAPSGTYEICTKRYTTIKELADLIGVDYEFSPPRSVDVSKITHEPDGDALGWKPKVSLEEGIEEMLK